jgi:transcriptional regulator with GAF, ATPase, and Fis domain
MQPRLVAIAGPLTGVTIPLTDSECIIGRAFDCQVRLEDDSVSKHHCVIRRSGEAFLVQDLGSRNGIRVNGAFKTEHDLLPGDEIKVGASLFLFADSVEDASDVDAALETIEISAADAVGMASTGSVAPDALQTTRNLQYLLRISVLLGSVGNLYAVRSEPARDKLSQHLLSLLMELIPAGSGEVLLAEQARASGRNDLQRVLKEKVALCVNNSLLAAPMLVQNEVAAILCLHAPDRRFDERHLELLVISAGIAAVAWENAVHLERLHDENALLEAELRPQHEMVGTSATMCSLQQQVAKVARSTATVLIIGESGTGKEMVARAIHKNSPRAHQTFAAINCASLGESLLESELCGHEKGAFTGAVVRKKGKLEIADGGTLFLDEIGELALPLQARLLRVLQEREFERVGGTSPIKVDIRIVAATNCDLEEAVRQGSFRQDLYYRLNVVTLQTPPLRERREDILLLAEHFVRKHAPRCGRRVTGISLAAGAYLESHSWPGNVRELENAIERAIVLGSTNLILPEDLPEHIREASRPHEVPATAYESAVDTAKRDVILRAFERAAYSHETAARILGLHPNYLHRLIRTMDLRSVIKGAARG